MLLLCIYVCSNVFGHQGAGGGVAAGDDGEKEQSGGAAAGEVREGGGGWGCLAEEGGLGGVQELRGASARVGEHDVHQHPYEF